jgi:hypothetical protein
MKKKKETKITARFPGFMELAKRKAENSLAVEVKIGTETLGTLLIGRGSVEWWPKGNSVNSVKIGWRNFVNLLEGKMK